MEITFIGLGIMGTNMAANLIRSKQSVTVWNRSMDKAQSLVKSGAKAGDSLAGAVKNADVIITMLNTPEVIENIAKGEKGFLQSCKPNALWINTSTVNPSFAVTMESAAKENGIRYLDAPVSGSKVPAEKAELVFVVGGSKPDLEEARPVLSAMGKAIHHLGEVGKGSAMKLVLNLVLAQAMAAFSEAIALGKASGLSQQEMFGILLGGPLTAPYLGTKRNKIEQGDFAPEFPLELVHKDLHLVLQTAYEHNLPLPLAATAKEMYGAAKVAGKGKEDISSIFSFISKE